MIDLLVIGAGLFGSVIGRYAQSFGLKVRWIDVNDSRAASKCSSGLFKPSWLTALSSRNIKRAYGVLESLSPLRSVQLKVIPAGLPVSLNQIAPESLLAPPENILRHRVRGHILDDPMVQELNPAGGIVLAAGIGLNELQWVGKADFRVTGKEGVSWRWCGDSPAQMNVWAPYKQVIVTPIAPGEMWGGDGTSVLQLNDLRVKNAQTRVARLAGLSFRNPRELTGVRPFVEGHKHGWLKSYPGKVWVATGGGKIGTVMAGAMAADWSEQAGIA